jgi:membrane protein DedA with SNARE-associated domain
MLSTLWPEALAALEAALSGMAAPWAICVALALTTLLLEDVAIAAGVAVAAQGALSWGASFAAVAFGIAAGDLMLYALGLAATRHAGLRRRYVAQHEQWRSGLSRKLPSAVLIARVVPGLRLVTYTACGYLRIALLPFCTWVLLAVLAWTAGLYALAVLAGDALQRAFGLPAPLAVALPIVVVALAAPLWRAWRNARARSSPAAP